MVQPPASDGMQDSMSPGFQYGSPVTDSASKGHALQFRPEDPQVGVLDAE